MILDRLLKRNNSSGGIVSFAEDPNMKKKEPVFTELAAAKRDYDIFSGYISVLRNPSLALKAGGYGIVHQGMKLFEEMENDEHLYSVMQTRILALLACPVIIKPNPKTGQKGIRDAEFIQEALDDALTFHAAQELALAIPRGYQVSEIMWGRDGSNIIIDELKGRKPERFFFDTDTNLRLYRTGKANGELMPPMKFCIHRFYAVNDNPYGYGVHNRVYWMWWFKKHGWKFWMIFSEKFGSPTAKGIYPPGLESKKDDLLDILTSIQQETAFVIPEGVVVELLEAQRQSTTNTYEALLDRCDAGMSKAFVGQTLTVQEGKVGSLALGTVHDKVRQDYKEADGASMAACYNENLIEPLCYYNGIEDPPYAEIDTTEEADLKDLAERDKILVKDIGLPVAKKYFYETFNVPEPGEGDDLVEPPAPGAAAFSEKPKPIAEFAEDSPARSKKLEGISDFNSVIDQAVGPFAQSYAEARGIIRAILKSAGDYKKAKRELKKLDIADSIAGFLEKALFQGRAAGMESAMDVLAEQGWRHPRSEARFAEVWNWNFGLEPEEALEWWRSKAPLPEGEFYRLQEEMSDEAFRVAGIENEYLINEMHDAIDLALQKGTPYSEWYSNIDEIFDSMGITPLKTYRLEIVLRNNMMSAYSEGADRIDQLPEVVEAFPYFMLDSVGDARARPEHAALDGKVISRDNPFAKYRTPYDHQCRCGRHPVDEEKAKRVGVTDRIDFVPPFG